MKIVILGSQRYREVLAKKMVGNELTGHENIIGFDDIFSAEQFFLNNVLGNGVRQHIDLIVADDMIDNNKFQSNFCDWIRTIDEPFSGFNFRLSSIPVILCKANIVQSELDSSRYNATTPFSEDDKDIRIVSICRRLVKAWRKVVLDDLSVLEINPKTLEAFGANYKDTFAYYAKISKNADYYFTKTKIVSNDFIKNPRKLDYAWISENQILQIERSLDDYIKVVRNLETRNRKNFERQVLHTFYNKNKFFLSRDVFGEQIYEQRYYVSRTGSAYHVPDFTLPAIFPGVTTTSISEIKRHNIFFEYNPKRHQNFTQYSQNALNQAENYQDDFEAAGLFEQKFQMDLIIGLDERRTEFIRRKLSRRYSTINVITHDELIAMVEGYYKRLRSLHAIIKS